MKIEKIKVEQLFGLNGNDYEIQCYPKAYTTIIFSLNGAGKTSLLRLVDAALTKKYTVLDDIIFKKLEIKFDNNVSLIVQRTPAKNGELKHFDDTVISELPKDENGLYYMPIMYVWQCKDGKVFEGKFYINENISKLIANEVEENPDLHFFINSKTKKQFYLSDFCTNEQIIDENHKGFREILSFKRLYSIKANIILANRDYNRIGAGQILRHKKQITNSFEIYDLKQLRFAFKDIEEIKREKVISSYTGEESSHSELEAGLIQNENPKAEETFYYISIPEKTDEICEDIKTKLEDSTLSDSLNEYISLLNEEFGFTDKSIVLDKEEGLKAVFFADSFPHAPELKISQLSAGEKNLIALLYELMFKTTKKGSIVLIDEPEASLHVDWQRALIENIRKICEKRDVQALIATHSPSVVDKNFLLMSEMGRKGV